MALKDKLDKRYSLFEKIFTSLLAACFAILACLVLSFDKLALWQIIIIVIGFVFALIAVGVIFKILIKISNDLERV